MKFENVAGGISDLQLNTFAPSYLFGTLTFPLAPDLSVDGNGATINHGDNTPSVSDFTDFGAAVLLSSATSSRTFTLRNSGTRNLALSGTPAVVVTGANASDFTVTTQPAATIISNGSASFTITFDPSAAGTRAATISVASNDQLEPTYSFVVQGEGASDSTAPTVSASAPTDCSAPTALAFPITWSEPVTGFTVSDLFLSNGSALSLSGAGTSYIATIAYLPANGTTETIVLEIPANAAEDLAGNLSQALPAPLSLTCTNHTAVQAANASNALAAASERADAVSRSEPQIRQRLSGELSSPASLQVQGFGGQDQTHISGTMAADSAALFGRNALPDATPNVWNIWTQGEFQFNEIDQQKSTSASVHVGIDRRFGEQFIVGALAQADWRENDADLKAKDQGWMVGPYVVFQIQDGLLLDARLAAGQTKSEQVTAAGVDTYTASRLLARAQLSGKLTLTPHLNLFNDLRVSSYNEFQPAYHDSYGVEQPARTYRQQEIAVGPTFEAHYTMGNGVMVKPSLGLKGSWFRSGLAGTNGASDSGETDQSLRGEAGLRALTRSGMTVETNLFLDGLGDESFSAFGGGLNVRMPLR